MKKVLISGGTGFVGRRLVQMLAASGYSVTVLCRRMPPLPAGPNISYAIWDVEGKVIHLNSVASATHIIHLAGAGVFDKRWTNSYKKEILDSRVRGAELLFDAVRKTNSRPHAFISASATGWYNAGINKIHEEHEPAATDFLGEVCKQWEAAANQFTTLGARVCTIRTGLVLGKDGGLIKENSRLIALGIAPVFGSGNQWMSWIELDDLCRLYLFAIDEISLQGPVNAVSGNAVTNRAFIVQLAAALRGTFYLPVRIPRFLAQLTVGGASVELYKSCQVSNEKILGAGFQFNCAQLASAIRKSIGS